MRPSKNERFRIFVTGATGPYGAHFAKLCLERGHAVFSLRHTQKPLERDSAQLLGIADRITWANGDIRDQSLLEECLATWEVQAVAHFAALPLVRTGLLVTKPLFEVNAGGTIALLDAVKQVVRGGQRVNFLMCSTDKVYGHAGDTAYVEDTPLLGDGPYEASKVAAEVACRAYCAQGLVPHLVTSRSCNIIATGDMHWRLLPNTIRQFLCYAPAQVYTKGQYVREFIDVRDAVEAQYQLLFRADEDGYAGQAFNIGTGEQFTQEQVIEHVREKHFPEGIIIRTDPPPHHRIEIPYQTLDSRKVRRALGWSPKYMFAQSVADLVAWWRERRDLASWSKL